MGHDRLADSGAHNNDKNPSRPSDKGQSANSIVPGPIGTESCNQIGESRNLPKHHASEPIEIVKGAGSTVFRAHINPNDSNNVEPIPLDQIIRTANTMSSIMMAHKIALDDDFKLEPGVDISGQSMRLSPIMGSSPATAASSSSSPSSQAEPSLQSRVKDIVHEAYWDLFREELASQSNSNKEERKFDISKQLLRDVKQRMIELLLPQHGRLKQDIEDKLDAQIVEQLTRLGSLDLLDYGRYIVSVLAKLCAPVRDDKIKELAETSELVQLYRGIMELLEMMRLDLANFTINRFKPHIRAHSQEYEREKFNEILRQQRAIGIDGLEYTRIWLRRAVEKLDAIHGISDLIEETASTAASAPTLSLANAEEQQKQQQQQQFAVTKAAGSGASPKRNKILAASEVINKILVTAYCELLEWVPDKQSLYPETLLFDESTFRQLSEQYKVLLLTSSVLLTTFAFAGRFKLQDNADFRLTAKSNVITLLTASDYDRPPLAAGPPDHEKDGPNGSQQANSVSRIEASFDQVKLETIAVRLTDDIRRLLEASPDRRNFLPELEANRELFRRQLLDLQSPSNRIRELARRRILEFVETLLMLDIKHQDQGLSYRQAPPVSIFLGMSCLSDEITLTMAQLVKITRYNRKVFIDHYRELIADLVMSVV